MSALAQWKDLCLDADDPAGLGGFWAEVIGLRLVTSEQNVSLDGADPSQRVWLNQVDRPKLVKNRLHLDVYVDQLDHLVELGATVLAPAAETGFGWTVLADPEGGEFCAFLREPSALPAYRLHGIGVDCADPGAVAGWWGEVFGVAPVRGAGQDWWTLERATPDPVLTLDFAPVPEPRQGPNRVHWDVVGEVEPLLAAGASRLWDTDGWTVLADPEGNEFCVFAPAG